MNDETLNEIQAWSGACRLCLKGVDGGDGENDDLFLLRWAQEDAVLVEGNRNVPMQMKAAADMEIDDARAGKIPLVAPEAIQVAEGKALVLFLHGAGQSSQTYATTVAELKRMLKGPSAPALFAYDARAHGATECTKEYDSLTKDQLVHDCLAIVDTLVSSTVPRDKPTHVFLVGHSMGGAIACWVAKELMASRTNTVQVRGLFVMDAVEELALSSLEHSLATVTKRPAGFANFRTAVLWALEHGMTQNPVSANVSMRGQLRKASTKEAAAFGASAGFIWRTDLAKSYDAWAGWFTGFSQAFVDIRLINKAILLAGRERLDQPMMVGHMQGKFKLVVFPEVRVGHFVHEDAPVRTAQELVGFLNRRVSLPAFLQVRP